MDKNLPIRAGWYHNPRKFLEFVYVPKTLELQTVEPSLSGAVLSGTLHPEEFKRKFLLAGNLDTFLSEITTQDQIKLHKIETYIKENPNIHLSDFSSEIQEHSGRLGYAEIVKRALDITIQGLISVGEPERIAKEYDNQNPNSFWPKLDTGNCHCTPTTTPPWVL